jgi:hypothetical protein
MEIKIIDNCFSHVSYSTLQESNLFKWLRTEEIKDICVITDSMLFNVDSYKDKIKVAWLIEPRAIRSDVYTFIENNFNKFDYIFTFDEKLLKLSDKCIFYPFGGCWVNKKDQELHNKTKLLSIIASTKRQTIGHNLRHEVIDNLKKLNVPIDLYGFGHNQIENKVEALKDYHYSIVIENSKTDYYFTEKLIDSFVTGTIPIYWGCPSIGNFFDTNGMLIFDTIEELKMIINSINEEFYYSKIESIKNNYKEAKKYLLADDIIYQNLKTNEKIFGKLFR